MLYALHQQATLGPCTEPKPWAWSVVESAKWQSWVQLGDMSSVEAMRLYVKLLDEEIQVRPASCLLSCQQTFALCLPLSRWVCHLIQYLPFQAVSRLRSRTGGRSKKRGARLRQARRRSKIVWLWLLAVPKRCCKLRRWAPGLPHTSRARGARRRGTSTLWPSWAATCTLSAATVVRLHSSLVRALVWRPCANEENMARACGQAAGIWATCGRWSWAP